MREIGLLGGTRMEPGKGVRAHDLANTDMYTIQYRHIHTKAYLRKLFVHDLAEALGKLFPPRNLDLQNYMQTNKYMHIHTQHAHTYTYKQ